MFKYIIDFKHLFKEKNIKYIRKITSLNYNNK